MTRMKWVSLKIERNSIWYLIISLLDVRDYLILLFILIIGFFFRGFRGRDLESFLRQMDSDQDYQERDSSFAIFMTHH